ncbi:MAG: hypothetical protein ABH852_01980 [Methanobacteriota archaeon]
MKISIREFGAVCDVSVLVNRANFELAQNLVDGGELYLPSATYSWLARDKLISVRGRAIGYSLVNQFVRDRELLVIYLPELLDELSRRLLFGVEREVPLTDLRASMLAAHLQLPLLTFSEEFAERLQEHVGARTIWQMDVHASRVSLQAALDLYRELASDLGGYLGRHLNNEAEFGGLVEELRRLHLDNLKTATTLVHKLNQAQINPGKLGLAYMAWDMMPILREYLKQHVVQPEVVRELCERALLLVASPVG